MPIGQPILIAGAGIAGLATALALARAGVHCRIFERREAATEEGAGIQIGPNGVAVLRRLGVADGLMRHAGVPQEIMVHDGPSGRVLTRLPLGAWIEARHGAPYWVLHRADLHAALLAACQDANVEITTGFGLTSLVQSETSLRIQDATGKVKDGSGLVGADGLWSVVREQVFDSTAPVHTGRFAARALVPRSALSGGIDPDAVGIWMSPDAHVVHYPVRQGREINVVVVAPGTVTAEAWSLPIEPEIVIDRVSNFAPRLKQFLQVAPHWRQWPLRKRTPLTRYARGRVALAGDAAHPTLPFLAQGAVMALEDAETLAVELAHSPNDIPRALQNYSSARLERTHRIVATAVENGRVYHLRQPMAAARNLSLRVIPASALMARYDWIYGNTDVPRPR